MFCYVHTFAIEKKLSIVKNHPRGEKSPNLVTLFLPVLSLEFDGGMWVPMYL
jgi:hypothetical protein